MANGFFLGGVAEGMADADKRAIQREQLAQDLGLRTRALDLTETKQKSDISLGERAQALAEKNAARSASREGSATADKHIAETMAIVGETIKNGMAAGRDPEMIQKAVAPLVDSAKRLAARSGRDPAAFDAQVGAMLTQPTLTEAATAEGTAAGVKKAATAKALAAAGVEDENAGFKDKGQKVQAENSLRDDFLKESKDFLTVRSFKTRIDNLDKSGAGDLALVFSFMKMLDPPSVVREGEQATAANAAGVPEAVRGLYNRVIGEGKMSDEARKQLVSQANKIYLGSKGQHDQRAQQFSGIAKRQGLNPDNVIVDVIGNGAAFTGVSPSGLKFTVGGK